jgi:rod shape-determining protein MreC
LTSVAKNSDVTPGDVVVTSEISSLFPQGIRIGVVNTVTDDNPSLFRDITLNPDVDISQLEEVFVVISTPTAGAPADSTN